MFLYLNIKHLYNWVYKVVVSTKTFEKSMALKLYASKQSHNCYMGAQIRHNHRTVIWVHR